jgi:Ca2+-binding RTX toxin-like protein
MRRNGFTMLGTIVAVLALVAALPGGSPAATRAATAPNPITLGDFQAVITSQAGAQASQTIGFSKLDRVELNGTGAFTFNHTVGPVEATSTNICGTAHGVGDVNNVSASAVVNGLGGLAISFSGSASGSASVSFVLPCTAMFAAGGGGTRILVTFTVSQPAPVDYSLTASVSATHPGGFPSRAMMFGPQGTITGPASGVLSQGTYTVVFDASDAGVITSTVSGSASGSANVQLRLLVGPQPPAATGPLAITGGPEASNLDVKVDNAGGQVRYTFTDSAPLQVSDPRCQAGPPIVCESPTEVPLNLDLGGGDDTMTVSGNHAFTQLTVNGGPDDDTLVASPVAHGGAGSDIITVGNCGSGQCVLDGGDQDDKLTGGPGDDLFQPGEDVDIVKGQGGSDTVDYSTSAGAVEILLNAGEVNEENRTVTDTLTSIENAIGSAFDDVLQGDGGPNRLDGGSGNDGLDGLAGADQIVGGAGNDLVSYRNHPAGVTVTLGDALPNDGSPGESDLVTETENVQGSDAADTLVGTDGPNTLEGFGGADTLEPREGADVLDGGDDLNTVDYSNAPGPVNVDLDLDAADEAAGTQDVLTEVENVIGSAFDDSLFGDDDPQIDNRLEGRAGKDALWGGLGADNIDGGPGVDWMSYDGSPAGVTVTLDQGVDDDGTANEGDNVVGIENVLGSSHADAMQGNGADNLLEGAAGIDALYGSGGDDVLLGEDDDDVIDGGPGNDTIDGGRGGDLMSGGADVDTVTYADRTQGVVVELRRPSAFVDEGQPGEGDDVDVDFENAVGGAGSDILVGNASANRLEGGDGNDALEGREGSDVLDGGFGDDALFSKDGLVDDDLCGPGQDDIAFADSTDTVNSCETVELLAGPPPALTGNTPAGFNVKVTPVDATTLTTPVTVTFGAVTTPGQTLLVTHQNGPIVPAGFQLGSPPTYYFISTTAPFSPPITICIDMTGIAFPTQPPRLYHFDQLLGTWVDITTLPVTPPQICGVSNTLSPFAVLVPIDPTPPQTNATVSPAANANGWNNGDVTVKLAASDDGSGVKEIVYSTGGPETTVAGAQATVVVTAEGTTTVTYFARDNAGNNEAEHALTVSIDKTPPLIACAASPPAFTLHEDGVVVEASVTDALSGAVAASTSAPAVTTDVGAKTVSLAAEDYAGNTATKSCPYSVAYAFDGFSAPVANAGLPNEVNAGQAVPLKFHLTDAAGNPVTSLRSARLSVASLLCTLGSTDDLLEETTTGSSGLQNHGDGWYQLNWKTPGAYASSCKTLRLDLGEGGYRTAVFIFEH